MNTDAKEPSLPCRGRTPTLFYFSEQNHSDFIISNYKIVSIIVLLGISVIKYMMTRLLLKIGGISFIFIEILGKYPPP